MIIIRTDAQSNRKALAGALSELFHEKPRYCGAPTFAYEFGVGRLARAERNGGGAAGSSAC